MGWVSVVSSDGTQLLWRLEAPVKVPEKEPTPKASLFGAYGLRNERFWKGFLSKIDFDGHFWFGKGSVWLCL